MREQVVIEAIRAWVEKVVLDLNLCPFAKREWMQERIRFSVTAASSAIDLLSSLSDELDLISTDDSIGTTLLIHPDVLEDFGDYLDFLAVAEGVVVEKELEGVIQIASFHPDYQFAGTTPDDASNYTNRSPYPLLHLIREADVEEAVQRHPDVASIPERNIRLMNELGVDHMRRLIEGEK